LFTPGGMPYTSPVGYFAPNGYGLHDMAGNVSQFCWDRYSSNYYSASPGTNPRGPTTSDDFYDARVVRGGNWCDIAPICRVAMRCFDVSDSTYSISGFRCVRGL